MKEKAFKFINQLFLNEMFEADAELAHLLSVDYIVKLDSPNIPEAITLNFENQSLTIQAVSEDSTIEFVLGKIEIKSDQKLISASQNEPWSVAVGKFVGWSWALINYRGYPDAIQFEFIENLSTKPAIDQEYISAKSIIIQLVTMDSSIYVYELTQIQT